MQSTVDDTEVFEMEIKIFILLVSGSKVNCRLGRMWLKSKNRVLMSVFQNHI